MLNLCRALRILALLALAGWSSQVHAAYIYQYTFEQSDYQVLPGQTVGVNVYLQETVSEGDTPWFTSANQGLFSGGVRVFFNLAPLPTDLAEVPSIANIIVNPLFTDPSITRVVQAGVSAGMIAAVSDIETAITPETDLIQAIPMTTRILLGTFNFTAGLVNNEVTHLLATDFDTSNPLSSENIVFNSDTMASLDLDSLVLPSTATITTIPEPSTFVGLVFIGLAAWHLGKLFRRNE